MKKIFDSVKGWIRKDGVLHMVCSFVLMLLFYIFGFGVDGAVILTFFVGCAKEMFDILVKKQKPGKDNIHDLICDVVGIALALCMVVAAVKVR